MRSWLMPAKLARMAKRKSGGWVLVSEAAKRLGLSPAAAYRAIKEGRLKASMKTIKQRVLLVDPKSLARFKVSVSHQARARLAKHGRKPARRRNRGLVL